MVYFYTFISTRPTNSMNPNVPENITRRFIFGGRSGIPSGFLSQKSVSHRLEIIYILSLIQAHIRYIMKSSRMITRRNLLRLFISLNTNTSTKLLDILILMVITYRHNSASFLLCSSICITVPSIKRFSGRDRYKR